MNFKLFLEAFLTQNIIKDIQSQLEKDKYVTIFIHHDGKIDLEYPDFRANRADRKGSARVSLTGDKRIRVDDIGGKLRPQSQKLIKELLKFRVIDNTWKVDSDQVAPGEYIGHEFTKLEPQINKKSVDDLLKDTPLTRITNEITLYHGTSTYDWEKIKKFGALTPLFVGSNKEYGSESRFKHEFNKNYMYLATDEQKAWEFAKQRARDLMRKKYPEEWKWSQYQGANSWTIKPVLLKVHIKDMSRLRSGDDNVNRILTNYSRKIWDAKSQEEKQKIMTKLGQKDPSVTQMVWRETEDGFNEIFKRIKPALYKAWLASMLREQEVAYDGIIPIKFIEEIPFLTNQS